MVGIRKIATYIPAEYESNIGRMYGDDIITEEFSQKKIGVLKRPIISSDLHASDMCMEAFSNLQKLEGIDIESVECICVCSQNPDYQLPNTAAIIHHRLGADSGCAFFDLPLGCSGYVYGLKMVQAFMENAGYKRGLFFTSDPVRKVVDRNDKGTDLLFGDVATVTLLSDDYVYEIGEATYESDTKNYSGLIKRKDEFMFMDGRKIFNFTMKCVPMMVKCCLEKNGMPDVDLSIFHQPSKYVLESINRKLEKILPQSALPFWDAYDTGNTASSSIPLILSKYMDKEEYKNILLCGFGVGLSAAALMLKRSDC